MRVILLIVSAAAVLVQARPDVSQGYKYNAPRDQYDGETPDHDAFGSSAVTVKQQPSDALPFPTLNGYQSTGSFSGAPSGVSADAVDFQSNNQPTLTSYGASSLGSSAQPATTISGGGGGLFNGVSAQQQQQSGSSFGGPSSSAQLISTTNSGLSSSSNGGFAPATIGASSYGTSSSGTSSSSTSSAAYPTQPTADDQSPIITKSFYFESAPDEPEEQTAPRYVTIGRAQKNYKVIFIKAPSYGINSQIIPIAPQHEEKTIIYVLSKKPEIKQDIELPPTPTTEPTKPDVFFIKYKSEQEAQNAQQQIQTVYERENVAGDAHYDEGQLQSIAHASLPNVISARPSAGPSSASSTVGGSGQTLSAGATGFTAGSTGFTGGYGGTTGFADVSATIASLGGDSGAASFGGNLGQGPSSTVGATASVQHDSPVSVNFVETGGHSSEKLQPDYLPPSGSNNNNQHSNEHY